MNLDSKVQSHAKPYKDCQKLSKVVKNCRLMVRMVAEAKAKGTPSPASIHSKLDKVGLKNIFLPPQPRHYPEQFKTDL